MKPWRKPHPVSKPPEKPVLTLIADEAPSAAVKKRKYAAPSYRLIFGFIALSAASLGVIAYFFPSDRWRWDGLEGTFSTLEATYRSKGMEKFLEQKALLKRSVADVVRQEGESAQIDLATNIAVYLFPEVLPNENFEKQIAEETWGEKLGEIEKRPHTPESRILFEALRADIWNYELVDKEDPKLSAPARQVIQIYDTISAP